MSTDSPQRSLDMDLIKGQEFPKATMMKDIIHGEEDSEILHVGSKDLT